METGRRGGKEQGCIFVDDKIVHVENPTELIINSIIGLNKVATHKISNEKSIEFTYTNNNQLKDRMNEKILFITATK